MLAVARLVACVPLLGVAACVAPGSGETAAPMGILATDGCGGEPPACVMGCAARAYIERATCEDGIWHCDHGVRHDLCCDPLLAPEHCPEWGDACGAGCPEGYTCVSSRSWPLPSDDGVCRLGDWTIPEPLETCDTHDALRPELLASLGPAAIKLEGLVEVELRCDGRRCTDADPCCQDCVGAYTLDLGADDELRARVALRTETISCVGNNCGFSCAPLQPGRRYLVWGLWVPGDAGTAPGALYLAGSCAD